MHDYRFTFEYTKLHHQATTFQDFNNALNEDATQFKLKKTHVETLRFVMILYVKQLREYFNQKSLDRYYDLHQELPPFKTYAVSLQKALRMGSKSTFYDHRARLENAGIIIRRRICPNKGCQLWYLNPILFANHNGNEYVKKYVYKHFEHRCAAEAHPSKIALNAMLSSISVHVLTVNTLTPSIVSSVNSVDNPSLDELNNQRSPAKPDSELPTQNFTRNLTKNTQRPGNFLPNLISDEAKSAIHRNKQPPGMGSRDSTPGARGQISESKKVVRQEIPAFIINLVVAFWIYTKPRLYPGQKFTPEQEKQAKTRIYYTYFQHWRVCGTSKDGWQKYYENLCKRVDISMRTVEKQGWMIPPPDYYFEKPNPDSPKEFKFWKTDDMHSRSVYNQVRLELKRWQRGKGRCKKMSGLDLMTRHYDMLNRIGNRGYLKYFNETMRPKYTRKA